MFVVKTKSMWCWGERESSENKVHMVYSLKLRVHFSRKQREGMILSFLFFLQQFSSCCYFLKLIYMSFICETTHSSVNRPLCFKTSVRHIQPREQNPIHQQEMLLLVCDSTK